MIGSINIGIASNYRAHSRVHCLDGQTLKADVEQRYSLQSSSFLSKSLMHQNILTRDALQQKLLQAAWCKKPSAILRISYNVRQIRIHP